MNSLLSSFVSSKPFVDHPYFTQKNKYKFRKMNKPFTRFSSFCDRRRPGDDRETTDQWRKVPEIFGRYGVTQSIYQYISVTNHTVKAGLRLEVSFQAGGSGGSRPRGGGGGWGGEVMGGEQGAP